MTNASSLVMIFMVNSCSSKPNTFSLYAEEDETELTQQAEASQKIASLTAVCQHCLSEHVYPAKPTEQNKQEKGSIWSHLRFVTMGQGNHGMPGYLSCTDAKD